MLTKPTISLRASVTDLQAEQLLDALTKAGLAARYGEEQHGSALVVHVRCTVSEESTIRRIFDELDIPILNT